MESTVSSLRKGISKLASQVKILNQQIDRIEKNKTQRQTAYTEPHHQNIQFARQYSTSSNNTGKPYVISYSSSIFYGVKKVNFEHNDFCIYKIYSFEIFSHMNLLSLSIWYIVRK